MRSAGKRGSTFVARVAAITLALALAYPLRGDEPDPKVIDRAAAALRAGKLDEAIQTVGPWLGDVEDPSPTVSRARELASRAFHQRGWQSLVKGAPKKAVADFDQEVRLLPELDPHHWQRGIALYYADEFERGAEQFERHRSVNPQDVENAVWHFLCVARAPGGSIEIARKNLIPIDGDPRVPMREIHDMFAGRAKPKDVKEAAKRDGRPLAHFYADLYIGLFQEVMGNPEAAREAIERAAGDPSASEHAMGEVARAHLRVRELPAATK